MSFAKAARGSAEAKAAPFSGGLLGAVPPGIAGLAFPGMQAVPPTAFLAQGHAAPLAQTAPFPFAGQARATGSTVEPLKTAVEVRADGVPQMSLQSLMAGTKASPFQYAVTLDKSTGRRLGIDDTVGPDGTLEVVRVHIGTGGLFEEWNMVHPNVPIKDGDLIVTVNGVGGSYEILRGELGKRQFLEMRLLRFEALKIMQSVERGAGLEATPAATMATGGAKASAPPPALAQQAPPLAAPTPPQPPQEPEKPVAPPAPPAPKVKLPVLERGKQSLPAAVISRGFVSNKPAVNVDDDFAMFMSEMGPDLDMDAAAGAGADAQDAAGATGEEQDRKRAADASAPIGSGDEPDAKKPRTAEEDMMARVLAFAQAKEQTVREEEEKERLEAEQELQREKEIEAAAELKAQEEAALAAAEQAAAEAAAAAAAIPPMDEAPAASSGEKESGEDAKGSGAREAWEYMKPTLFQSQNFFSFDDF